MVTKKPVAGSLIKASMMKSRHRYDLWAIVVECREDPAGVQASVVEVVPENYVSWTHRGIEPPPAGTLIEVPEDKIEIVIHPRVRMTKKADPHFVIKLNDGRVKDIYAMGKGAVSVRLVDLAKHYGDNENRQDFHRDVLVTRKGIEKIEDDSSIG